LAGYDIRYSSNVPVFEEALPSFIPLFWQRIRWTEGSVIRYLEHIKELLLHPRLSFRVKCDASQFLFEFIAPLWLLLENTMFLLRWPNLFGQLPNLVSPAVLGVLSLYFFWHLFKGIKQFVNPSIAQSIKGTLVGYLYLSLVWLPLVFTLIPRILFSSHRNRQWIKTPHYGVMLDDAA
jgi:cellulose synthase/poly-beta-1,6-N-acetylglucosamine synthase-like glycosyltransferase